MSIRKEDLLKRDKLLSLDITWLRDLQAALDQFALIAADLLRHQKP